MKPSKQVRREIEALYLRINEIRHGTICIFPELERELAKIQEQVWELFQSTSTIVTDNLL